MPSNLFEYHTMGETPPSPDMVQNCNPSSVGRQFSFTMPSGKIWTFSKEDDTRARAFYCGGGPVVNPPVVQSPVPDGIGCPTNPTKNNKGEVIAHNLAKSVGSMLGKMHSQALCLPGGEKYLRSGLTENDFHSAWMQTAIGGMDSDGYTWNQYTNTNLRKNCPATFKKLYDIANEEYKRNLRSFKCQTLLPNR